MGMSRWGRRRPGAEGGEDLLGGALQAKGDDWDPGGQGKIFVEGDIWGSYKSWLIPPLAREVGSCFLENASLIRWKTCVAIGRFVA
jgi:hypothetical protein